MMVCIVVLLGVLVFFALVGLCGMGVQSDLLREIRKDLTELREMLQEIKDDLKHLSKF